MGAPASGFQHVYGYFQADAKVALAGQPGFGPGMLAGKIRVERQLQQVGAIRAGVHTGVVLAMQFARTLLVEQ